MATPLQQNAAPFQAPTSAAPVGLRKPQGWRTMSRIGMRMLLHDRLKLGGILIGIIATALLSNINIAILLANLAKNTALITHSGADIWITPPSTRQLNGAGELPDSVITDARTVPGVAWVAPMLMGQVGFKLPMGGARPETLIGVKFPTLHGGPWNMVAGNPKDLKLPDAVILDDSEREKLGGVNLGTVGEFNGHMVMVVGFTVGLQPWAPAYSFARFLTAREILHVANHRITYGMVGLAPGANRAEVLSELRRRAPEAEVLTRKEITQRTIHEVLVESGIGASIGTSTFFAVMVGFVIVALTMFSAVLDHMRELGTLKAIGATNWDLAKLLISQSVLCALVGGFLGEGLAAMAIHNMHAPEILVSQPGWLIAVTMGGMLVLTCAASLVAMLRMRKLEPVMVFRG